MSKEPEATRPEIPGGYLAPKLIAWPWAETRLREARNYWVTSVSPAGAPHARPVWGVWLDGRTQQEFNPHGGSSSAGPSSRATPHATPG